MSENSRLIYLLGRHFDDALTVEEAGELNQLLENSADARVEFWREARINARLRQWGEQNLGKALDSSEQKSPSLPPIQSPAVWNMSAIVLSSILLLLAGFFWLSSSEDGQNANEGSPNQTPVAKFISVNQASWVAAAEEHTAGEGIVSGQRLELSAGQAEIEFLSGATIRLRGPAIFEAETDNAGFLTLGQIEATAETPASKGFTVRTRTATVIDQGTQFLASAGQDGHSIIEVTSGSVNVEIPGREAQQRVVSGNALGIEPGLVPVVVNIERGDETPEFRFATIEPPSGKDLADMSQGLASVSILRGELRKNPMFGSGPAEVLLDGQGQRRPDAPTDSLFFNDGDSGLILLDLGTASSLAKINTYTWHQNGAIPQNRVRAVQKFTVYGYDGEEYPDIDQSLTKSGWVRIARVNSDAFFEVRDPYDRPAQQGCSIAAARGSLGTYRYLLFQVEPTASLSRLERPNHTFYGEIDVYAD